MFLEWIDIGLKIVGVLLIPMAAFCIGLWARVNRISSRVDQIEREVAKLPTADSFNELKLEIEEMRGETRVLGTRIEGLNGALTRNGDVLNRVEQFLLNSGRSNG